MKGIWWGSIKTGEDVNEFIAGPTIQGEQGRKATCEILMEKLIELGQDWVRLEEELSTDSDVDCRLYSRRRGVKELEIQVTKADKSIWPELAKGPVGIPRSRSIDAVCESLFQCIFGQKTRCQAGLSFGLGGRSFPSGPGCSRRIYGNLWTERSLHRFPSDLVSRANTGFNLPTCLNSPLNAPSPLAA